MGRGAPPGRAASAASLGPMLPSPADEAVIRALVEVLSGRAPLSDGEALLAEDVLCHLDGLAFRGRGAWRTWIAFIRSRPGIADLGTRVESIGLDADGRIVLSGRWTADKGGTRCVSAIATAAYRIENGRIAELWSTRTNYTFMLGHRVRRWPGCLLALAEATLAARVAGRRDAGAARRARASA